MQRRLFQGNPTAALSEGVFVAVGHSIAEQNICSKTLRGEGGYNNRGATGEVVLPRQGGLS